MIPVGQKLVQKPNEDVFEVIGIYPGDIQRRVPTEYEIVSRCGTFRVNKDILELLFIDPILLESNNPNPTEELKEVSPKKESTTENVSKPKTKKSVKRVKNG